MSIKQIFVPELVEKIPSEINGELEVIQFMGDMRLDCGGLTQSGVVLEKIWKHALDKLVSRDINPKRILMLGVGAGSSLKVLSKQYRGSEIVGVELDPAMIDVAKKYFDLGKLPNIEIVIGDAIKYVKDLPKDERFDLILVDCYQGDKIPMAFEDLDFLSLLREKSSIVLLNRLFWSDYKTRTLEFLNKLDTKFNFRTTRTPSNLIVALE